MSRIGSCNFREKEKSFNTQAQGTSRKKAPHCQQPCCSREEETWRQTCEKERFIEAFMLLTFDAL